MNLRSASGCMLPVPGCGLETKIPHKSSEENSIANSLQILHHHSKISGFSAVTKETPETKEPRKTE
jgi:hypothetical protein